MKDWDNHNNFDQSITLYGVDDGKVHGGSDPERKVKEVKEDTIDGYYPGGDFTFELDLTNRSLVMEINHERIILDANLGDFQYSPFIRFFISGYGYELVEVTLL